MRYRLLTPIGVAGAIALGAWIPNVTSASAATPSLAPLSPQAVLAKALAANVRGFSGTVRWTANLGLPSLSALTSGVGGQGGTSAFDPTSLLSGSHDFSVWDAGAGQQRLALPGSLSEVDVVHNGTHLYYYDSATQKVTDYTGAGRSDRDAPAKATGVELTPDQAAQKLLAGLDPSTVVTSASPVYVAHQAAYQVTLAPKAAQSTVGAVTIAVDAANGMALRLQVFPRGSTVAALSLGFTSVSFSVPSASNFAAPHGSTTVTKPIGQALSFSVGGRGRPGGHHMRGGWPAGSRPAGAPRIPQAIPVGPAGAAPMGATTFRAAPGRAERPTTIGTGWATIAVFASTGGELGHRLDQVSSPVTGSFGTARLVTSSLLNALILPDGKILAGFVTPSALEAAAGTAAATPAPYTHTAATPAG